MTPERIWSFYAKVDACSGQQAGDICTLELSQGIAHGLNEGDDVIVSIKQRVRGTVDAD